MIALGLTILITVIGTGQALSVPLTIGPSIKYSSSGTRPLTKAPAPSQPPTTPAHRPSTPSSTPSPSSEPWTPPATNLPSQSSRSTANSTTEHSTCISASTPNTKAPSALRSTPRWWIGSPAWPSGIWLLLRAGPPTSGGIRWRPSPPPPLSLTPPPTHKH